MSSPYFAAKDAALVACRDHFGVPVVYERGSTAAEISAEFIAPGTLRSISSGVVVETTDPTLVVRLVDLAGDLGGVAMRGDRWTVDGVSYRVAQVRGDGEGSAELTGEKQL